MFQLFKERNFSDYINDTFLFFKVQGKHFFKSYFTINGPFLLIAVVLIYFFTKIYMDFVFSMISGGAVVEENYFGNYFLNAARLNAWLIASEIVLFSCND